MNSQSDSGVYILSGANQLLVEIEPTEDHNYIVWTATISGEDFFNGPWAVETSGVSDDSNHAFQEAAESFVNPTYGTPSLLQRVKAELKSLVKNCLGLT